MTFFLNLDLFDNPVTFVRGYKSTMIDLLPKLRVLDRKSKTNLVWFLLFIVLF
jgi:hypothetical protein